MKVLMVDIRDTNNTLGRLENEWDLLEEVDIDDRDLEAIRDFAEHRRDVEDKAANTIVNDLGNLRRSSLRGRRPLVDMTMADVRAFLTELATPKAEGGYGLEPDGTGIFNYERALKLFFEFLDEEAEYDGFAFYERIELSDIELGKGYDRDQVLTEGEITQLKTNTRNDRDRTLIDFLGDTGARISLATSLRCGDVKHIDSEAPEFVPNEEAINLKGVEITEYPILHSRGELRTWLNIKHPEAPSPPDDAPLFPVIRGYDPNDRRHMAASPDGLRDRLEDARDRAGIGKPVKPHAFRHVTLTRIANAGLDDRDLEHMSMLADLRMIKEVYDHTTGSERNKRIQEQAGFIDDDVDDADGGQELTMETCWNCRHAVKSTDDFCSACGADVDESARSMRENAQDDGLKDLAGADLSDQERKLVSRFVRELRSESGVHAPDQDPPSS